MVVSKADSDGQAKVAILMCTFNGEQFISAQLESIAKQKHQNWVLWVSDDGSTDNTLSILKSVQADWGHARLKIVNGPCKGFARNFLSLACRTEINADYYAFSDQDDIWLPEKLSRGIGMLEQYAHDTVALYGSRTRLINTTGKVIGTSTLIAHDLSFQNALVQSIAGGNTMIFNHSLCEVLRFAGADLNVVSHDWWLYIVATATRGKVVFDRQPYVLYRQHKNNLVGANSSIAAKLERLSRLFSGHFKQWMQRNQSCIQKIEAKMPADFVTIGRALASLHSLPLRDRIMRFKSLGLRRQSRLGTWVLLGAVLINQV